MAKPQNQPVNRRHVLHGLAAAGAATALAPLVEGADDKTVVKGRIKQSVVFWCFNTAGEKWSLDKTCQVTKDLGGLSVELTGVEDIPTIKKHGLTCAIAGNGMPGRRSRRASTIRAITTR